LGLNQSNHQIV